jgi:hypothetical protein
MSRKDWVIAVLGAIGILALGFAMVAAVMWG